MTEPTKYRNGGGVLPASAISAALSAAGIFTVPFESLESNILVAWIFDTEQPGPITLAISQDWLPTGNTDIVIAHSGNNSIVNALNAADGISAFAYWGEDSESTYTNVVMTNICTIVVSLGWPS